MKIDKRNNNLYGGNAAWIMALISNPADKKKLEDAVVELSNSMTRVDAERDLQKDIVDRIADEVGVEKKYVKKLATIYHRQTFAQVQTEQEELESLYEDLFGQKRPRTMVVLAQLVRVSDCDSEGRRFEPDILPQTIDILYRL